MNKKKLEIVLQEEFNFLLSEYDCKLSRCKKEKWGIELLYLNNTSGVKINYEYHEGYIFIMLYKLINGVFHENPKNIDKDTILFGYDLDDIISIFNQQDLVKRVYEYGENSNFYVSNEGVNEYIKLFALNLKKYSSSILRGDFSIFFDLDKIVKTRIEQYK